MDGTTFVLLVFLVPTAIKLLLAYCKKKEEEKLRNANPEVYAHLKQIEHEERMLEHDKKRMRHENIQTGAKIVRRFFE